MLTKGEKTKENILNCAEKVFSHNGYYESQVADISAMAHVAKGTIYQYFENKGNIFTSLLENYVMDWEREVALNLDDFIGTGSPKDYAKAYLRHRLSKTIIFFAKNQDRANIILRMSPGLNEEIEQVIRIFENTILKSIINDIKLGQKFGHISKDLNLEMAGNAILGSTLRIAFYYFVIKKESYIVLDQESFTEQIIKLAENTLNMYNSGK